MAVASETINRPAVRWGWLGLRVLFGVLLVLVIAEAAVFILLVPNTGPNQALGDHAIVMDATRRWMAGGPFYPAYETAGPFVVTGTDILYPPNILPLFVVMSFLPDVLWWAIPLGVTAAVLAYWRPTLRGWTIILLLIASPLSFESYAWGNPAMWMVMFVALGTIYHWPSVFVLLKPTLAPFALVGIRHRSWWVALAALAVVSLPFLPMWFDYLAVSRNVRGEIPFLHSYYQVGIMLVPIMAKWATTRKAPTPEGAGAVTQTVPLVLEDRPQDAALRLHREDGLGEGR